MATLAREISLSELASMPENEAQKCLGELLQTSVNPSQEQLVEQKTQLDAEIQRYESQYGMTSSEMKHRLSVGELRETAEFCSWLMLLKIRGRFDSAYRSSRTNPI